MKALLLSAGLGTRLQPLTDVLPKCLVPIDGRPLLEYWLELLEEADIKESLINLHYHAEQVQTFLKESKYGRHATPVYEKELLGTGGTLLKNRSYFGDGPILLVHADNLSDFDIRAFIQAHRDRPAGTEITMMTFHTSRPETCGIVELDDMKIVRKFHEKVKSPPSNLANAAVYILEPSVIEFLASLNKDFIDFSTEVLPRYLGKIQAWQNDVYHRDIGSLESLTIAQFEFAIRRRNSGIWDALLSADQKQQWQLAISDLSPDPLF